MPLPYQNTHSAQTLSVPSNAPLPKIPPITSGDIPTIPQMPPPQIPIRPPALPQVCGLPVGQEVEVFLRTNIWVVGIIVGTLKFFHKFAGWGYEISYRSASSRRVVDQFPSESVRPRQHPAA